VLENATEPSADRKVLAAFVRELRRERWLALDAIRPEDVDDFPSAREAVRRFEGLLTQSAHAAHPYRWMGSSPDTRGHPDSLWLKLGTSGRVGEGSPLYCVDLDSRFVGISALSSSTAGPMLQAGALLDGATPRRWDENEWSALLQAHGFRLYRPAHRRTKFPRYTVVAREWPLRDVLPLPSELSHQARALAEVFTPALLLLDQPRLWPDLIP
jgi:hypothetical protein